MMSTILQDTRGMTIAEVVIALGVITVGLLALISTMPLSTSAVAESNLKTTATFLAQQRLEQVKNAQWCPSCGAAGALVDTLGGEGSNGGAAVAQWPDEAYNTIAIPAGSACPTNDPSVSCYSRFSRKVRIADCSIVSCSGLAVGTPSVATLRQVTVTVTFRPVSAPVARDISDHTGTGTQAQPGEESVQIVTLIARRS
jgi:type II secretory pathway pseudopilin PulG